MHSGDSSATSGPIKPGNILKIIDVSEIQTNVQEGISLPGKMFPNCFGGFGTIPELKALLKPLVSRKI